MIPEYLFKQEKEHQYLRITIVSSIAVLLGFYAARTLFPSQLDILTPVFAAIPIIYPLTAKLLDDESENRPHSPEIKSYLSIFVGQLTAFFAIALLFPDQFSSQSQIIGAAGYAVEPSATFTSILINNLTVFTAIFLLSTTIASAGAFVLTWNASVMGVFFATLLKSMPNDISLLLGTSETPSPIAFLPHSTFEITGFVIAGISGTLLSAALYRKHFDEETLLDIAKLTALGLIMIVIGVILETG